MKSHIELSTSFLVDFWPSLGYNEEYCCMGVACLKKLACAVFALCVLIGSVTAYNGNVTVYITNSGSKYHEAWCSYLKSSNAISLENAVSRGYLPCSRCNPPNLNYSAPAQSGGDTFAHISPDSAAAESRSARLMREMEAAGLYPTARITELEKELRTQQALLESARNRLEDAKLELNSTKEMLKQAQEEAQKSQDELDALRDKLQVWGICGVVIGLPVVLLFIWQICWKCAKANFDRRVESEILKRLAAQKAETPSLETEPPQPPVPLPSPVKGRYNAGDENPYLREAYRQRYEGKSLSDVAGVPKDCGVKFDRMGYPHRKNALHADEFTVYITEKGKSYHTAECSSGARGKPVNICFAKWQGRGPCERCKPMADLPGWVEEYQRILRIRDAFGIDMLP